MTELQPAAAALALDAIRVGFPDRPFPAGAALIQQGRWFDEQGQPHS